MDDATDISGPEAPGHRDPLTGIAVLGGGPGWSVAQRLRLLGVAVMDAEPPPAQTPEQLAEKYGFGFASVRAGRLAHLGHARQVVEAALAGRSFPNAFWTQPDGSVLDALRVEVDPHGLPDRTAAEAYRQAHLATVRRLVLRAQVLILCPITLRSWRDPADGTLYPEPSAGVTTNGLQLTDSRSTPEAVDADFAALHALLKSANPALRLRLVIRPSGTDLAACADEAVLRALAGRWVERFSDVSADPVFDHLLDRAAQIEAGSGAAQSAGAILSGLLNGAELGQLLSGAVAAPAPTAPLDKAARKERRRNREAKRQKAKSGSVVCEDELLEAFS